MAKHFPNMSERKAALRVMQGLQRANLLDAISKLNMGIKHPFGESTNYDVLHEARRYAPKAVVGLAMSTAAFDVGPYHFKGGLHTPCFRILKVHGFEIVPKRPKQK